MSESLNGLRIPLIIDAGVIIAGVVYGTLMWGKVEQLMSEREVLVSPERIARIEAQLEARTDERYRAGDARRDFELRDERIRENITRLERLERRVLNGHGAGR
jgi:hypothetical protein